MFLLTAITNPIIPNKGYWVYLGTGASATSPITIDVTGTVRKFNNAIPLTRTNTGSTPDDGWNLIHNPYPSPIRWSSLRNGNLNVDNANLWIQCRFKWRYWCQCKLCEWCK
ncbi:MAG: hypothetical protein IPH32_16930 [Bacteroidetes bacterium]|nr:hypothetical protein [Bacteroidota bacterium]